LHDNCLIIATLIAPPQAASLRLLGKLRNGESTMDSQQERNTRESGLSGGEAGWKDEIAGSGVCPASGSHSRDNAEI
jgi:hypothetical protein